MKGQTEGARARPFTRGLALALALALSVLRDEPDTKCRWRASPGSAFALNYRLILPRHPLRQVSAVSFVFPRGHTSASLLKPRPNFVQKGANR